MKYFYIFSCSVIGFLLKSQNLNVPVRQLNAMNGTQFIAAITPLSFTNRENLIYNEVIKGNVPNFYRTLSLVTSTAVISGSLQSVSYYVTPDYLAIGCDSNYFLCPMSPIVATKIADSLGCTLPTRKMVNDIYTQASLKLTPLTIPASGTMTTVQAFAQHNSSVTIQRNAQIASYPLGTLTGGDKKDVVISNQIYTTANRVVIYGWHTSVGNPIQPLSNVHADTYMDYSHGMRFIQNSVVYNGNITSIKAILQSSTLNTLLSNEGVITPAQYPYNNVVTSLAQPKSFAVINKANNTLQIKVKNDVDATHYKIQTSTNGITFNAPQLIIKTNLILSTLTANQIYYVKIAAYNATTSITSTYSELLAAVPCNFQDSMLIVNGFDRVVAGNTFDFVKQHGGSIYANNHYFSSATNEAIQDGLVALNNYKAVNWILGKESTITETFSNSEQTIVANYLKQGGNFLVSGSEIAWDLDNSGSTTDKTFIANYLKATYLADAPNNQASTWYKVVNQNTVNSIFNFTDTLSFDNGTQGTYNVDYPDVLMPVNGSTPTLLYTNNITSVAAICFSGIFPSGTTNGKVVYFGFPLETIVNTTKRTAIFANVWYYFFANTTSLNYNFSSNGLLLYPNPTKNSVFFKLKNDIVNSIMISDINNKEVLKLTANVENEIDLSNLDEGIYFITFNTDKTVITKKIIKLKN